MWNPNSPLWDNVVASPAVNGLVAGSQSGRPPDGAVTVDVSAALERQGSPVAPELQPAQKKGRSEEEPMMVEDTPPEGGRDLGGGPGGLNPTMVHSEEKESSSSLPSFKDKLLGNFGFSKPEQYVEELDVEVKEEDVRVGGSCTLPEIRFSDRVHAAIDEKLVNSLIVRLLGRFARVEDFNKVLTGGPWMIYGTYLTVQPWSRSFSVTEAYPSQIMVWVRLPKLSCRYYTKSLFRHIAEAIGKVVRVDYNTSEGKRGRFARLAIVVDLNKPLVSGIIIDGIRQDIEYEGLPVICYKCGRVGHSKEQCGGDCVKVTVPVAPPPRNMGSRFEVLGDEEVVLGDGLADGLASEPGVEEVAMEDSDSDRRRVGDKVGNNSGSNGIDKAPLMDRVRSSALQGRRLESGGDCGSIYGGYSVLHPGTSSVTKAPKGRVLPSSVRGPALQIGAKKGGGGTGTSRLGVKQKKRDERGGVNPGLQDSLVNLVTELDQAANMEEERGRGAHGSSSIVNGQVQWRANSAFERPSESGMQGALDPTFYRAFQLLVRSKVPDIVAVFEPRISGIWVLWKDSVHVDVLAVSSQFVHGFVKPRNGDRGFFTTFVYASPEVLLIWVTMVLSLRGGGVTCFNGLIDVCVTGTGMIVFLHLRFFIFSSLALIIDRLCLILIWELGARGKTFRYILAWNDHDSFSEMWATSWSPGRSLHENVVHFQEESCKWNRDVFGHIDRRKTELMAQLKGIE
ncbi:hypothetical protein GQ457_04G012420 [Hibiscus cannabinus]